MSRLFTANPVAPRPILSRDQAGHVFSDHSVGEIRAAFEQKQFDRNKGRSELASAKRAREASGARLEGAQTFGIPSGCEPSQFVAGVERLTPQPLYPIREEWEWFPAYGNGMRRHPMGNDQNTFYGSSFGRRIESNPLDTPRQVTLGALVEAQHPNYAVSTDDLVNRYTMRERATQGRLEDGSLDTNAEDARKASLASAQEYMYKERTTPATTHDAHRQNPHHITTVTASYPSHDSYGDTSPYIAYKSILKRANDQAALNADVSPEEIKAYQKDKNFQSIARVMNIPPHKPSDTEMKGEEGEPPSDAIRMYRYFVAARNYHERLTGEEKDNQFNLAAAKQDMDRVAYHYRKKRLVMDREQGSRSAMPVRDTTQYTNTAMRYYTVKYIHGQEVPRSPYMLRKKKGGSK